jgi:hypothetical protein
MGTAQVTFAVERCGGATGSDVSHVTGSDASHVAGIDVSHVIESMICACATGSCTISALVRTFDRK